jgi:muramoyltetrapeptide carboxypeptidase LdcA involved in peptidoglycan recycling
MISRKKAVVISHSSNIESTELHYLPEITLLLENAGFDVELDCKEKETISAKIISLQSALLNSSVNLIFELKGGKGADKVIEQLPKSIYKNKAFISMSDGTFLLNTLYNQGVLCYHGPLLLPTVRKGELEFTKEELEQKFIKNNCIVTNFQTLQPGKLTAPIFGGNIRCFSELIKLNKAPKSKGLILLLEALETSYEEYKQQIEIIKDHYGSSILGVILGNFNEIFKEGHTVNDLAKSFQEIPIIHIRDLGHTKKNTIIPIGIPVTLDTYSQQISW